MIKHRKTRRKKRKQKKIIIISSTLSLLLLITIGYAAFSTNLSITAKGNIKEYTTEDYVQDSLFLHLDGIYNTKQGHNQNATSWENLIDNGYSLTMLGYDDGLTWANDNGLEFDGTDDYIDSGFNQSVLGNEFTFEFVSYPKNIDKYQGFFGYHYGSPVNQGVASQFMLGEVLSFGIYGKSGSCGFATSNEQLNEYIKDKKSDILLVFVPSSYMAMYINGQKIGSQDCNITFEPIKEYNLFIGKSYPDDGRNFDGTMYNFKIYRKALTEEEVKQNYRVNKQRYNLE